LFGSLLDVEELYHWHVAKCDSHPHFKRITDQAELDSDAAVQAMTFETEESKKVSTNCYVGQIVLINILLLFEIF